MKLSEKILIPALLLVGSVLAGAAQPAEQAESLLAASGRSAGIFCFAGGDGSMAIETAVKANQMSVTGRSPLVIHVLNDDYDRAAAFRHQVAGLGLDGQIYTSEGDLSALPYPDNFVNTVVLIRSDPDPAESNEVMRVLAPGRGKALYVDDDANVTTVMTKDVSAEYGDWTHRLHGADNNPVSEDTAFSLPGLVQYLEMPRQNSFQGGLFIADGRRIELTDWVYKKPDRKGVCGYLLARDLYNGQILWRRALPSGIESDAPIATGQGADFYIAGNQDCSIRVYDPETGEERPPLVWSEPALAGNRVKWLATENGKLYALIGPEGPVRKPYTFMTDRSNKTVRAWQTFAGTVVACVDLSTGAELWRHTEEGDATIDYRTIAVKGSNVYFFSETGYASTNTYPVASQGNRLVCLDSSGAVAFQNGGNTADPDSWINRIKRPVEMFNFNIEANPALIAGDEFLRLKLTGHYEEFFFLRSNLEFIGSVLPSVSGWDSLTESQKLDKSKWGVGLIVDGKYRNRWGTYHITETGITKEVGAVIRVEGGGCGIACWVPGMNSALQNVFSMLKSPCGVSQLAAGGLLSSMSSQCDCGYAFLRGAGALAPASGLLDQNLDLTGAAGHPLVSGGAPEAFVAAGTNDWTQYRGGIGRQGSSAACIATSAVMTVVSGLSSSLQVPPAEATETLGKRFTHGRHRWEWLDRPTPAVTAGGMAFFGDSKGVVRGVDIRGNVLSWEFRTGGPVLCPPVFCGGRVYAGSGDGWLYCLNAATGQLVWRYRGAPLERRMMVYGKLCSPWPVMAVTEYQGRIFALAGHLAQNGTVVFGLNAADGSELWTPRWVKPGYGEMLDVAHQPFNNEGRITVFRGALWVKTNSGFPAVFDPDTGQRTLLVADNSLFDGAHSSEAYTSIDRMIGSEAIVLNDEIVIQGGRPVTANPDERHEKVAADYYACYPDAGGNITKVHKANRYGLTPPSLDGSHIALTGRNGASYSYDLYTRQLSLWSLPVWQTAMETGSFKDDNADWTQAAWIKTNLDVSAVVICDNAVVAAHGILNSLNDYKNGYGQYTAWKLSAFRKSDGAELWSVDLPAEPVFNGVAPASDGTLVVVLRDGRVVCLAGPDDKTPDADSDGIPDWWEAQYFGGPTNANTSAVAANGINTVLECYTAGIDPTDESAAFRISDFRSLSTDVVFGWDTVSGRVYSVYWTSNLLNGFQPLASNLPWMSGAFTDAAHSAGDRGFYKLEVKLAP